MVLSNGSSFLNIGVIFAVFSSFGNLFCFIHSFLDFLVGSNEFMILEMSSLFVKLKTNNCLVSVDNLILKMLG